MTRTLVEEARALLAVWDDTDTEGEDVAAAIERLRAAVDPLGSDVVTPIQHPRGSYLLCVWVKQGITQQELNLVLDGTIAVSKQLEADPDKRVYPVIVADCVERVEMVPFELVAEAGASRSQESAG